MDTVLLTELMTHTAGAIQLRYGRGDGLTWLSELGCTGNEASLFNCSHSLWDTCSDDYSFHAGVQCPGMSIGHKSYIVYTNNIEW